MANPKPRLLVIRGGAIGDFILTLPAIRLLRENLASCDIEILGYTGITNLAVAAGLADSTRSLNDPRLALLFARNAEIPAELADYFCSFNIIVSYLYDPDAILRSNLERIGVKSLIDMPERLSHDGLHACQQLARPLQKLALFLEEPQWRLPVFPQRSKSSIIAIHLGSGSETKNWHIDRWQRLIKAVQQSHPDIKISCITGEAESARGITLSPETQMSVELWHELPLSDLADRLSPCRLFLGHDSGISHLASTCGVPCLLLFGPTSSTVWAPPQTSVQIIQAPEGKMELLPYETVWDAVNETIAKPAR